MDEKMHIQWVSLVRKMNTIKGVLREKNEKFNISFLLKQNTPLHNDQIFLFPYPPESPHYRQQSS